MTFFEDYLTFTIDKRYEDSSKSGIIKLNTAYIDPEESDRFIHKRLYGIVTNVPNSYSDTLVKAIDPGLPQSKMFVGHDWIVDKINRGYKNHSNKDYYPSTFDAFDVVTVADVAKKCDIIIGDTIYFDEKVTEPDNYLGLKDGKEEFRVRIDDVFCVVRDGKIITQAGWVLVEPDMETWDDITTKSGIIKKPKPEAISLRAVIKHASAEWSDRVGKKIIYIRDADWLIKIEGVEYYVIQEADILGEV